VPELPEVETVRRGLDNITRRQIFRGGQVLRASAIAYPFDVESFWAGLTGAEIVEWQRRGKYLLARLDRGWLGVHLRMSGQLFWLDRENELQKHTRVRFFFDEERELRFVDTRTFGKIWWVPPEKAVEEIITGLKQLGVELLSPEFDRTYLEQQFKNRRRPIKSALLDQGIIAGIGNIYADESLFKSGIHPLRLAASLSSEEIEQLREAIVLILETAIASGGTTFSSFVNLEGVNGNYMGVAWVYGRTGEPCRVCGTAIERLKIAGRSSHFCPGCQRR